MYYINKIVGFLVSPIGGAIAGGIIAVVCARLGRKRLAKWIGVLTVAWLWLWSTPMVYRWVGLGLEREWPVVLAEDAPDADAIVILGGGIGSNTNVYPYAEMWGGADRVWHAARLWNAGKAPIVITSGTGDRESTVPLLRDLGIPDSAIVVEDKARNTEENARFVEDILSRANRVEGGRPRILLVTSAWHMRRSELMFKRYAPSLEIIPAATDYEALVRTGNGFALKDLIPSADFMQANSYCLKEYIGYWGYKLLRK